MTTRTLLCGVAAAVAATAPALGATPAWHPGLQVAPFGSIPGDPAVALAARGEAVAAWSVAVDRNRRSRVEVRVRHGFTAPWRVAFRTGTFGRRPAAPAVGVDPSGAALVVWRAPGGDVRSAFRATARGTWAVAPVPSGPVAPEPFDLVRPRVAVAADGSAHVLWATRDADGWVVRGARRAADGRWAPIPAATAPGATAAPRIAITSSGDAVAGWVVPDPGMEQAALPAGRFLLTRRAAGSGWTVPAVVADATRGADVDLTDGSLVAAWGTPASDAGGRVVVARGTVAAGLGPAVPVAPGSTPRVAAGEGGTVALLWAAEAPGVVRRVSVRAAVDPGTGWTTPATLATSESISEIEVDRGQVDVGPDGTVVVAWLDPLGPGAALAGIRSAGPDGVFSGPDQSAGSDLDAIGVATAAGGTALVLTPAELAMSNGETLYAASLDAAPRPSLRSTVRGVRRPGGREVAWTVSVRNRGPAVARGVRLTLSSCCGSPVVSARPAGVRTTTVRRRWDLGTLRPGAARVVRLTTRSGPRADRTVRLFGTVTAVAVPAAAVTGAVRR
jgi:hypothetical protein